MPNERALEDLYAGIMGANVENVLKRQFKSVVKVEGDYERTKVKAYKIFYKTVKELVITVYVKEAEYVAESLIIGYSVESKAKAYFKSKEKADCKVVIKYL